MKNRETYTYLMLDGMPYVIDEAGKNWVFASTTKRWEHYTAGNWDARHPTVDNWFEKYFAGLPELPA